MPYGKKTSKIQKKTNGKTKRKPSIKRSSITKIVKQTINNQAETKHLNMDPVAYGWVNTSSDNSLMFDAEKLTDNFNIGRGTADGQRVGNSVSVTKCVLNMNILANSTAKPSILSCFIGHLKGDADAPISSTELATFLQDGNSSVPMTPDTLCLLRNVNRDSFVVDHQFQIKIGTSMATNYTNNDFPLYVNKKISLKKLMGKMTWNDSDTECSKDLYIWFYYNLVDGTLDALNEPIVNYYLDVDYKDF